MSTPTFRTCKHPKFNSSSSSLQNVIDKNRSIEAKHEPWPKEWAMSVGKPLKNCAPSTNRKTLHSTNGPTLASDNIKIYSLRSCQTLIEF